MTSWEINYKRNADVRPYRDDSGVLGLSSVENKYTLKIDFDRVKNEFILKRKQEKRNPIDIKIKTRKIIRVESAYYVQSIIDYFLLFLI